MLYRKHIFRDTKILKCAQSQIIAALDALVFLWILNSPNPLSYQIPVLWAKDFTDIGRIYGAEPTKSSN